MAYWSRKALSTLFLSSASQGSPNAPGIPLQTYIIHSCPQTQSHWRWRSHPPVSAFLSSTLKVGSRERVPCRSITMCNCLNLASESSLTLGKTSINSVMDLLVHGQISCRVTCSFQTEPKCQMWRGELDQGYIALPLQMFWLHRLAIRILLDCLNIVAVDYKPRLGSIRRNIASDVAGCW